MENQPNISLSHSVYLLRLHIVLETKSRRKVFTVQRKKLPLSLDPLLTKTPSRGNVQR